MAVLMRSIAGAVMLSLGCYVISRLSGFFLMLVSAPAFAHQSWVHEILAVVMTGASYALPRLDLLAQGQWLIAAAPAQEMPYLAMGQTLLMVPLLIYAAIISFRKCAS
jgi:hypothetical protein